MGIVTTATLFKLAVIGVFIASALYVHYRGRVKFRFFRQLTDHSTWLAPFNALMYVCSRVPPTPYLDPALFPELAPLTARWQEVRDEALRLYDQGYIRAPRDHIDIGFHSFFKGGYKRFYLKWYDTPPPSAQKLCPATVKLIESIPSVSAAMFALLPPNAKIVVHRDPYAGSIRYHLGLVTPNDERCRIIVDGEARHWEDGKALLFDETYVHHAENGTDQWRLILFCDVERPVAPRFVGWINHGFRNAIMRAAQTENLPGEKIGVLNQIFRYAYRVRLVGKAIKAKSRFVYYVLKWALIGGALFLIFRP